MLSRALCARYSAIKPLSDYSSLARGASAGALGARDLMFALIMGLLLLAAVISPHIH